MNLGKESKIINEKLFCETQRIRIINNSTDKAECLERLEKYAYKTGRKICKNCYEVYKGNCKCG